MQKNSLHRSDINKLDINKYQRKKTVS